MGFVINPCLILLISVRISDVTDENFCVEERKSTLRDKKKMSELGKELEAEESTSGNKDQDVIVLQYAQVDMLELNEKMDWRVLCTLQLPLDVWTAHHAGLHA